MCLCFYVLSMPRNKTQRNVVANISNKVSIYKNLTRIISKIVNKTDWGSVNRFWFINRRNMITTLWGKQEFMTINDKFRFFADVN